MKTPDILEVECFECETAFEVNRKDVDIELDEYCSEDYSDCWWSHIYRVMCPECKEIRSVDILTENVDCCLH